MSGADVGGISSVVLNYYRFLNRRTFRFDVAVPGGLFGQDGEYFRELGSELYTLPVKSKDMSAFKRELSRLLREGSYDAVHVHENETSYVALKVAK